MFSRINVLAMGVVLSMFAAQTTIAKQGGTIDKATQDAQKAEQKAAKEAEKSTKEAEKVAKKAAQEAEKAAKDVQKQASKNRIELIAKMKEAEVGEEVDVAENEASLKFRSKNGAHKLTAEVEGFADGDIFRMYVVVGGAEVLVSEMELILEGDIPRQQVEFDDATWPTGIPLELTEGTIVRLRDSAGELVLEGSMSLK
ncbi:hypothetical protein [Bdellovibrio sp. HCB2-146]|uniref:hypothetical protein n=1 Tax=Bdellovibrio sp. HCB2-146 TaxID=3394362 RepID=UPI0039BCA0C5